jgi:pyridine nucleotide-disulfide oxidoreductase family protein
VKQWIRYPIANCRLVCISNFPYTTYSGMLPGTLAEQFQPPEMQIDLKALCAAAGAELSLAQVDRIDMPKREIHFNQAAPLPFDALSIGIGSIPAGNDTIQARSLVPIKPMQTFLSRLDEQILRVRRDDVRSKGEPLRVAIVGGGLASVEIALCLQARLVKQYPGQRAVIQIITAAERVASELPLHGTKRIQRILTDRGVELTLRTRITQVTERAAIDSTGVEHTADCILWAPSAVGPPLLQKLGLPLDDKGFIATDATLRAISGAPIFAVGDSGTILDSPVPKAGVYAVRQSPVLWHNLQAVLGNRKLIKFKPQREFLKLINTGDGKALLQYGWLTFYGRWCWRLKTHIDKRFIKQFQQPL